MQLPLPVHPISLRLHRRLLPCVVQYKMLYLSLVVSLKLALIPHLKCARKTISDIRGPMHSLVM